MNPVHESAMHERDVVSGMAVFVAVVEGGSLAEAARTTGLTPSAVSKLVSRLEHGFGAPLLRRTTRSMTLTESGQAYFDRARSILEDLRDVEQEMASRNAEPRGRLRLSAPMLLGQIRVVPIVLAFQRQFQAVSIDLDLTDRAVDLVGERIDVAVRITSDPPPSFVCRKAGDVRRVLCASPAYLRSKGTPRTPSDLTEHNCLLLSGPAESSTWQLGAETVRVAGRLRASNTMTVYEAAKAGLGVADLPRYLVADDLRARRLVTVLGGFEPAARSVFVIYAPGPYLPARVRELANHLTRELAKVLDPPKEAKPSKHPKTA